MRKNFKDHFSGNSDQYQTYRPGYPQDLFRQLSGLTDTHDLAWDCATGNGQAASELCEYYSQVVATDASQTQIRSAVRNPKICYWVATAERSAIRSGSVDLIAVAQAMHWFDLDGFTSEVSRVLKPGGILAAWTYGLTRVDPGVDAVVNHLYGPVLDAYWPPERKLVENGYQDFELPLPEIDMPEFKMTQQWTLPRLMGYLGTWSAVKRYRQQTGVDPLAVLSAEFHAQWGEVDKPKQITWPLRTRVWRKP